MSLVSFNRVVVATALAIAVAISSAPAEAGNRSANRSAGRQIVAGIEPAWATPQLVTAPGPWFRPYSCITGPGVPDQNPGHLYLRLGWATLEQPQDQRFIDLQSLDVLNFRIWNGTSFDPYPLPAGTGTWGIGEGGWSAPELADDGSAWRTFTFIDLGTLAEGFYQFDLTASINSGSYGTVVNEQGGTPPGPWVSVTNCGLNVHPLT